MFNKSTFSAPWWLKNPHGQTILAKYLRHNTQILTYPETIELPDGDFVELAWTEIPDGSNKKPIVVMLHGLEGSKKSHYAKGMLKALKQQGWIGVLMHFRGCGDKPNRQGPAYHSADTRDISYLSSLLPKRFPHQPFFLIGISIGASVLTRYLAENPNNPYKAACAVCAPLDLASCSDRINQGTSKIYQRYLVGMLRNNALEKVTLNLLPQLDADKLEKIKTMREFDQYVTAPINGFKDADDYYQRASGQQNLTAIKLPCLFIHAKDDPFLHHEKTIAFTELPKNITFEITETGGHVGFVTGNNPFKPIYWLEHRIPAYFTEFL